ncbi:hypothetical protein [Haloarcula sebkhae]|uniref:DUF998 domain-containing protein n=2 Tax=Haloarcula sebkhae TaxID=932660 RepID=A0A830EZF0_9EURY|nr:hypothetical protein [Haloarcula sebkhae]GGK72096.1 hypothetical protein GCM10009067_25490 [Haloarcula sebkhae]
MWRRSYRLAGPLLGLSAVCLLITAVPLELWPTPRPGDSYVFNPPPFSAIWVQRTLRPGLIITANALLLVGLGTVLRRDSASMSRLQRVLAFSALVGAGACLLGTLLFTTAGTNDIGRELTALLILALAIPLIILGLVGWGTGYLRADSTRLGAALTVPPVLAVAYIGLSIAGIDFSPVGRLLLIIPTSGMALVVGYDLWTDNTIANDR